MPNIRRQPLLTSVVGSYPTDGLPVRRAIERAVEDQLVAGVDVISDGQPRGDMIEVFASRIPGIERRDDGVWEVFDTLDMPSAPILASDYALARTLANRRAEVKGIVTGPITLALSLRVAPEAPYNAAHDPAMILRLTEILGREMAALVAAGARVTQVDEPLLPQALAGPVPMELATDALREFAATSMLPILHVCGDVRDLVNDLLLLNFAVYDIENTRIPNVVAFDDEQLDFSGSKVSAGCVDTASAEVETVEVIRERIRAMMSHIPPERLWVSPDCGMRLLPRGAALEKLKRMVTASQELRAEL
ncbi:MAG TPA: uroporphyrinogen decarboxylase family protein [Ktedonobacterales bacterium]|nr:uroporphyrinogen decarboxylase family protein [Ktedonobacterales bacterium]